MTAPKFSIVIPTRNRAGLLRHALATAVALVHDDLEILVSDNCSSDDTGDVATTTGDPRVRYVRSDSPLSNADSWEFAVSHATGEWITVLGDDDGLVPSLLERVEPVIDAGAADLVAWGTAYYVHPDTDPEWPVEEERNRLSIHPHSGRILKIDAADQLRRFFERREIDPIPGVRDCFVRRSLLDVVQQRAGRLFGEPDPNWSLGVSLLPFISSYTAIDLPLSLTGCSPVNIGGAFLRNTRDHSVIDEFDTEDLFREVALQARTCINVVAESLMRAKRRLPDELGAYELDPVRYFVTHREELADPRRAADAQSITEWRSALRRQPRAVRSAVRREVLRNAVGKRARLAALRLPVTRTVEGPSSASDGLAGTHRLVSGTDGGFTDAVGAVRSLDSLVLPSPARTPSE